MNEDGKHDRGPVTKNERWQAQTRARNHERGLKTRTKAGNHERRPKGKNKELISKGKCQGV